MKSQMASGQSWIPSFFRRKRNAILTFAIHVYLQ